MVAAHECEQRIERPLEKGPVAGDRHRNYGSSLPWPGCSAHRSFGQTLGEGRVVRCRVVGQRQQAAEEFFGGGEAEGQGARGLERDAHKAIAVTGVPVIDKRTFQKRTSSVYIE